eukprot:4682642-Prymnesium_polylepis.1
MPRPSACAPTCAPPPCTAARPTGEGARLVRYTAQGGACHLALVGRAAELVVVARDTVEPRP